jgi:hypothetical protein
MKSFIVLDTNDELIFPLVSLENTYQSKLSQKIRPLGDTNILKNYVKVLQHLG